MFLKAAEKHLAATLEKAGRALETPCKKAGRAFETPWKRPGRGLEEPWKSPGREVLAWKSLSFALVLQYQPRAQFSFYNLK